MSTYDAPDFLNISSFLSEEELQIQKTMRHFVTKEIIPTVRELNRILFQSIKIPLSGFTVSTT